MIILSMKHKDKFHKVLDKTRKMEEYISELMECLEELESEAEYEDDDYYQERGSKGSAQMRGRYNYRMR